MTIKHLSNNGTVLDVQSFLYDYPRHITTFIDSEPIDYIGDDVLWKINERGSIDNEEEVILNDVAKCLSCDYSLYLESEEYMHIHSLINEEGVVKYEQSNILEDLLAIFNRRTKTKEEKEKSFLSEYKKSSYQKKYEAAGLIPIEILLEVFIEHLRIYASLTAKSLLNLIYKYYRIVKELSEIYEDDEYLQKQLCILRPFVTTVSKPDASAFSADFNNLKFVRKLIFSLKELSMIDRSLLFNFVFALNNLRKDEEAPIALGLSTKIVDAPKNIEEDVKVILNKVDGNLIEINFTKTDWLVFKEEKEDYTGVKKRVIEVFCNIYNEFVNEYNNQWSKDVIKDITFFNKGEIPTESTWREFYYAQLCEIRSAKLTVKNLYDPNFCYDTIVYNHCPTKYNPIVIGYPLVNDVVEVLRINKTQNQEYLYRRIFEKNYIIKEAFRDIQSINEEKCNDRNRCRETVDLMMHSLSVICNNHYIENCDKNLPSFEKIMRTILLDEHFLPLVKENRPRTYPFNLVLLFNIIGVLRKPIKINNYITKKPLIKGVPSSKISTPIMQAISNNPALIDNNRYKHISNLVNPSFFILTETQVEIIKTITKEVLCNI